MGKARFSGQPLRPTEAMPPMSLSWATNGSTRTGTMAIRSACSVPPTGTYRACWSWTRNRGSRLRPLRSSASGVAARRSNARSATAKAWLRCPIRPRPYSWSPPNSARGRPTTRRSARSWASRAWAVLSANSSRSYPRAIHSSGLVDGPGSTSRLSACGPAAWSGGSRCS